MGKRNGAVALGVVLLALAGCAAPAPEPTPTAEAADPNRASCWGFREETTYMLRQFDGSGTIEIADQLAAIDSHALAAEGDVKTRMMTFLDELPSEGDLFVFPSAREDYNALAVAVGRACEASGSSIELTLFVTD